MSELRAPAETAIRDCLAVGSDESVAVVTDDDRRSIGEALYEVAAEVTADATIVQYQPGDQHGEEPPAPVAGAMADCDVFLAPTTKSISHTRARKHACEAGARGATLPGITESVFTTGLDADYESIARECERMLELVSGASEVRVTTDRGTDLTIEPGGRQWHVDTGLVHESGDFSNLPAGEVFVSPRTASGTVVVDGTMRPHGLLEDDQTVRFEVEDGYVTEIDDTALREQVEDAALQAGDAAYNFAELGIGTNVAVEELVGSVLLDEKAAGTIHVAIGDDASIGGDTEAPLHLDGIVRDPTVSVDGEPIELPSR